MASINDNIRKFQLDNSVNVGDCYFYFENSKIHPARYYSNNSTIEPDETRYAIVTGKKESSLNITIPQYVVNPKNNIQYRVLEIGIEAFFETNVESVSIKANLERINYRAFEYCKSLREIVLPDSIKKIGEAAFGFCSILKSINIPCSLKETPQFCFYKCESLESVTLGDNLTKLEGYSFGGCKKLKNVVLPKELEEIGWYCFQECECLTSIIIPPSVKKIGDESFKSCSRLESVSMLSEDIELHWNAFLDCRKLKYISVPQGKRYPAGAFTGCVSLPQDFVSKLDKSDFSDRLRKEYNKERREKSLWYKALGVLFIPIFLLVLAIGFCIFAAVSQFVMAIAFIAGTVFVILLLIYGIIDHFKKNKGDSDDIINFITVVSIIAAVIIVIAMIL